MEIDRAKKPALKAVLQGDAAASRPMVLCVSRIYDPSEVGDRLGTAAALVEVGNDRQALLISLLLVSKGLVLCVYYGSNRRGP